MDTPLSPSPMCPPRRSLISFLRHNPVIIKELRGRMRGARAFLLITIYIFLLSGLVGAIYLGITSLNNAPTTAMDLNQSLGKTIFWVVAGLELCMICFIAPALTAGAVSGERERQTYDILRTTLLSERALIFGKMSSSLVFLVLLLTVAFPLQSLAFFFGGITLEELLISFAMLLVTALAFCSIGIFISTISRRVVGSTVISYIATSLFVFAIPIFIYVVIFYIGNASPNFNYVSAAQQEFLEILIIVVGWIFIILNPIAATIATEYILIEEQSFLSFSLPLSNGTNFFILSPWIGYLIFYLLLSIFLLWCSTQLVKHRER
jgi:ABC-2 type transport system permease protein